MTDAHDQRLLSQDELLVHEHRIRKALKATAGLIRHLESTQEPPRLTKRTSIEAPHEPEPEPEPEQ
jgi:hypothetical protein